jgi:hypothetical protein
VVVVVVVVVVFGAGGEITNEVNGFGSPAASVPWLIASCVSLAVK